MSIAAFMGLALGIFINQYIYTIEGFKVRFVNEKLLAPLICVSCLSFLYFHYGFNGEMVTYAILLSILIPISIIDIKSKLIAFKSLLVLLLLGLFCLLFIKNTSILEGIITCFFSAIMLFSIHMITKGGIGLGDVYVISFSALYLGAAKTVSCISISILLSGVFGLLLIVLNRDNIKKQIAFTPFIFIGVIIAIFLNQ